MRTIVIGDIHGCIRELKSLIKKLIKDGEYVLDEDRLIFLGDYIDRGDDSRAVVDYVRDLCNNHKNIIALRGNHEEMAYDFWKNGNKLWFRNSGQFTIQEYKDEETLLLDQKAFADDVCWGKSLPVYFEDDNFIYVHAGFSGYWNTEADYDEDYMLWARKEFIYEGKRCRKTVIFGHTPFSNVPFFTGGGNLCIDTGCVYGERLTAVIIEDGKIKRFCQKKRGGNGRFFFWECKGEKNKDIVRVK